MGKLYGSCDTKKRIQKSRFETKQQNQANCVERKAKSERDFRDSETESSHTKNKKRVEGSMETRALKCSFSIPMPCSS